MAVTSFVDFKNMGYYCFITLNVFVFKDGVGTCRIEHHLTPLTRQTSLNTMSPSEDRAITVIEQASAEVTWIEAPSHVRKEDYRPLVGQLSSARAHTMT